MKTKQCLVIGLGRFGGAVATELHRLGNRVTAVELDPELAESYLGRVGRIVQGDATTVQFPGLAGVLPGFGTQRPNDWGLGFELRDGKSPHWTGSDNSPRTFGHFGQSGTFLWVDPEADIALIVLTDRDFGDWTHELWPAISDGVLREIAAH